MTRTRPEAIQGWPSSGEQTAMLIAATPKAADTACRDQENSSASGLRKMPNV